MRARTLSSLVVVLASLLLSAPAVAEPCSHPGSKKGHCYCKPPLTKVCGPVWNEYFHQNFTQCWCHNPAAGDAGFGGSYGHAEIHKKNVPQTHPTSHPDMDARPRMFMRPRVYMRGAAGPGLTRRSAFPVMRQRW